MININPSINHLKVFNNC